MTVNKNTCSNRLILNLQYRRSDKYLASTFHSINQERVELMYLNEQVAQEQKL
jgi:hypothetical protein